ncbi:MAG: dethiobiotin synthase [Nanoarchaeota archaeon]|nr:dethiobiotin synthase [Nanoarchaeota archaeon]
MTTFFITGTDTGVGKTISTALLAKVLKTKGSVAVYKPLMCGDLTDEHPTQDLKTIQEISNLETNDLYDEYTFKLAASPHLAAEKENKEINKQVIIDKINELKQKYDFVLIEGAGGLLVPVTRTYSLADLIQELNEEVIVVARAALGTINHSSLTIEALKKRNITIKGIILNFYTDSEIEQDNARILEETYAVNILAKIPKSENIKNEVISFENL